MVADVLKMRREETSMSDSSHRKVEVLARHSVAVIEANQAATGAYVASPNFPVYRYSWFRDGAFIADAMSRAGRPASAEAFFSWCAGVLEARVAKIDSLIERHRSGHAIGPDEFLHARYTVDGREVPIVRADSMVGGESLVVSRRCSLELPIAPVTGLRKKCQVAP